MFGVKLFFQLVYNPQNLIAPIANDGSVIMSISNYVYWNVQKRPQPSKKPSENVQKPPKMPKMLKKMKNPQNRPKCQKRQILSWVSSRRPNFFLGHLTAT